MNRLYRIFGLGLCLVCLSLGALAEPATGEETIAANDAIGVLVTRVEEQLDEIHLLSERLQRAGTRDRNALLYRRDQRSLQMVKLLDQLTPRVMALASDDPLRLELEQRLRGDLADVSQVVFERLYELDDRIDEQSVQIEELKGVERIESEAYLESLA